MPAGTNSPEVKVRHANGNAEFKAGAWSAPLRCEKTKESNALIGNHLQVQLQANDSLDLA